MVSIPLEKISEDWRKGMLKYRHIMEKVNGGQFLFVVVHLLFSFDECEYTFNTRW